jgi:membrane protein
VSILSAGLRRVTARPRRFLRAQYDLVRDSIERFYEMDGIDRSMAIAAQAFTALIPLVIISAVVTESGKGKNLADQIVDRFGLDGATADAVRRGLPSTGAVEDGLSALSVFILVVSALSFTRALQRMYARAWDVDARGMRDTGWGIAWLAVVTIYVLLHPALHGHVSTNLGLALSFAGGTVFWLFTPYVILARQLSWRRLVPQAVLTAIGMDAFRAASSIYMPHALASSAKQFGTLGFAFSIVSWLFGAAVVITAAAAIGSTLSRTVPTRYRR